VGKRAQARADWRKKSKYNSKFEAAIAADLEERGIEYTYESQTLVWIQPAQTRKYTPDFFLPNGIIVESKGKWSVEDRKKMLLVIEQNPELDIRMLFQYDNKLSKRAKQRYSDWCERKGIKYAFKTIPEEWLNEEPSNKE